MRCMLRVHNKVPVLSVQVVTCSDDMTVRVWKLDRKQPLDHEPPQRRLLNPVVIKVAPPLPLPFHRQLGDCYWYRVEARRLALIC